MGGKISQAALLQQRERTVVSAHPFSLPAQDYTNKSVPMVMSCLTTHFPLEDLKILALWDNFKKCKFFFVIFKQ